MADRSTKVTLTAQVQGYVEGMEKAARATRETGSEAEKLSKQREAMQHLGRTMLTAGGAIAAGLVLASKAAIDWDSAWAGVLKTVDGTPEQLADVEDGLRGLTSILPASHTEIAAVAEAAGQLGIETPNVVAFTKTMIDLGETTNLSAEEAAMSLARFVNIMGTSQSDVDRLGSSLVGLGNNFATTESEILAMSTRLAKSGVQIGLSEGEVMGLATALSSVGIEAEAGGSAMSKVLIDIAASVESGSDKLQLFSRTAGMSADDFAAKWRSEPAEALAAFVQGLANAEAQGGSTLGMLEELGITEVRMRDALLGSAAAADQFAGAMAMGNEEFEKNTALVEEADKRYETTAAKLDIMKNKVVDTAISLGEHLLPAIEFGAESVGNFADMFASLDGPMGAVATWAGVIIGTGLLAGGIWMTAVPKIAEYRAAMESLNLTGGKLERTLKGLGNVATLAAAVGVMIALAREADVEVTGLTNALERNADATDLVGQAAEAVATRGYRSGTEALRDFGKTAESVNDTLGFLQKNWWEQQLVSGGARADYKDTTDALRVLGDELANVASTDLSAAQDALSGLASEYKWTADEMWTFIENSPNLKTALEEQAGGLGLSTEKAELLRIAMGEVRPKSDEATEGIKDNADALAELEGKSATTSQELSDLADVIRGLGSAQLDLREANRRLEESYDDFTAVVKENGWTLDTTSQQGRAVEAAIDSMAKATVEAAAATLEQTGSQEAMNAKLAEGRERLIDMVAPYFETRDAAAAYVDELGLVEPERVTDLVNNAPEQALVVGGYNDEISAIDTAARTTITADVSQASYALGGVLSQLEQIRSGAAIVVGGLAAAANADGGIYAYANGGIASYASGGISEGIYKGGPPIHKFAEPETGWEAYISGKPSERDRNRKIWAETGSMLGMSPGPITSGVTEVVQSNQIYMTERDPRLVMRQLGRELKGALS